MPSFICITCNHIVNQWIPGLYQHQQQQQQLYPFTRFSQCSCRVLSCPFRAKCIQKMSSISRSSSTDSLFYPACQGRQFCFSCHLAKADVRCNGCRRQYHEECVNSIKTFPLSKEFRKRKLSDRMLRKCQWCVVGEKTVAENLENLSSNDLCKILQSYVDSWKNYAFKIAKSSIRRRGEGIEMFKICDIRYYESENAYDDFCRTVAKKMDLIILSQTLKKGLIKTMEGLIGELKWIAHNSVIFNGSLSKDTKCAKEFEKHCCEQLDRLVKSCIKCELLYLTPKKKRPKKSFVNLCENPHPVAWVKIQGFPPWPAKVVTASKEYVQGYFFGDYKKCTTTLEKCQLFAENHCKPTGKIKMPKRRRLYKIALEEVAQYLDKVAKKFGSQIRLVNSIPLEPFSTEFLMKVFPNEAQSCEITIDD